MVETHTNYRLLTPRGVSHRFRGAGFAGWLCNCMP